MASSNLLIQDYAGVTVVSFTESAILDSQSIEAVGKELARLPDVLHKQKLIVDFSDVKFLSSQAIGVLLDLHQRVQAIKGTLLLCGVRKEIMKVFHITNLDRIFKFFPDDASALKNFGITLR
jgi:anti-sigma B factor antagonist